MMEFPFVGLSLKVPSKWIDVNGHMNAMHYTQAVYEAHVNLTEAIGLGENYVASTHCGKAVLESHMVYEREVSEGDELEVISWLLAVDKKRLHFFHEVFNRTTGFRAACSEQVDIHIDLTQRGSSELPDALYLSLQAIVRENLKFPEPQGIGRQCRAPKNVWLEAIA